MPIPDLPKNLDGYTVADIVAAGYQHLDNGTLSDGDVIVSPSEGYIAWAAGLVGRPILGGVIKETGDFRAYRKMPVPSAAQAAGLERDVPPVHHSTAGCGESAQAKVVASQIAENTKLSNPKDMVGSSKVPMHLFPSSATALGALALLDGALKYGRGNWRAVGVRSSIYYDAAQRHLMKWFEGEDTDPDSGLPHLAHALACIAILVDAKAAGKLNDDRAYPANFPAFLAELTPHVERLKDKPTDRDPKHYTIADAQ